MAKGTIAKEAVVKKIAAAFGGDFLGEVDKKIYVQAPENGEMVQIAISLTCPKNPVAVATDSNGDFDFEAAVPASTTGEPAAPKVTEITQEERNNIAEMMKRLGL